MASETPAASEAAAWQALHDPLQPHDRVALLSLETVNPIDTLNAQQVGKLHQMIAPRQPNEAIDDHEVVKLTERAAPEMFDLAQKAKPGPFAKRTHQMGNYTGIRDEGRLIAMAANACGSTATSKSARSAWMPTIAAKASLGVW